jgi:hypothetical protein
MAEPHWSNYIAMATGIFGANMGYISYRRGTRIKSLDLRLEFRMAVSDVHADLERLRTLVDTANKSRHAVLVSRGMARSGPMEKWKGDIAADRTKFSELFKRAPKAEFPYDKLSMKELESELVAIHTLKGEIRGLLDKYSDVLRADDEERKQLREDELVRSTAHLICGVRH